MMTQNSTRFPTGFLFLAVGLFLSVTVILSSAPAADMGERMRQIGELMRQGYTPLMIACSAGNVKLAKDYLDGGHDVNHKGPKDQTALMIAAVQPKHPELVELLVSRGADVKARDYRGITCLMFAAGYGNVRAVKLFLKRGANVNAKTHRGKTVLMFAKEGNHKQVIRILKAHGAR